MVIEFINGCFGHFWHEIILAGVFPCWELLTRAKVSIVLSS